MNELAADAGTGTVHSGPAFSGDRDHRPRSKRRGVKLYVGAASVVIAGTAGVVGTAGPAQADAFPCWWDVAPRRECTWALGDRYHFNLIDGTITVGDFVPGGLTCGNWWISLDKNSGTTQYRGDHKCYPNNFDNNNEPHYRFKTNWDAPGDTYRICTAFKTDQSYTMGWSCLNVG